jgi:Transposase/Homeodomain-like domain
MVYTSPTKKARIVHYKNAGMTNDAIAQKFHIHRSTVSRIYGRHAKLENYYDVKPKPGRPRKFTPNDVRFAARTLANAKAHDVSDLQRQYFPGLHPETIRRRLAACGLKAYVRRKRPFLTEKHKKRRLEWAKAHQHWTAEDWKAVIFMIFSDESKFNLFGSDVGLRTVTVQYGLDGSVVRTRTRAVKPLVSQPDGRWTGRTSPSNTVQCTAVTALDGIGRTLCKLY